MCDAVVIGVATGLMSAVQSIAGYQAQSQAASASERHIKNNVTLIKKLLIGLINKHNLR
jgi:hypothetical protein